VILVFEKTFREFVFLIFGKLKKALKWKLQIYWKLNFESEIEWKI
jgi:hypothetical protein